MLTSETILLQPVNATVVRAYSLEPYQRAAEPKATDLLEPHIAAMAIDAQKKTSWMGFPEPSDTDSIPRISAEEVAKLMGESNAGRSIQLVDVRRSDLTVSACSR